MLIDHFLFFIFEFFACSASFQNILYLIVWSTRYKNPYTPFHHLLPSSFDPEPQIHQATDQITSHKGPYKRRKKNLRQKSAIKIWLHHWLHHWLLFRLLPSRIWRVWFSSRSFIDSYLHFVHWRRSQQGTISYKQYEQEKEGTFRHTFHKQPINISTQSHIHDGERNILIRHAISNI